MYCVYCLYNKQSDKIYIGQTESLKMRLEAHNTHKFGGYTSRFKGLWQVIYSEEVESRSEALIREKQLKSYQGREFVEKHIPR